MRRYASSSPFRCGSSRQTLFKCSIISSSSEMERCEWTMAADGEISDRWTLKGGNQNGKTKWKLADGNIRYFRFRLRKFFSIVAFHFDYTRIRFTVEWRRKPKTTESFRVLENVLFLLPWISLSCEAGGRNFHGFVRFITDFEVVLHWISWSFVKTFVFWGYVDWVIDAEVTRLL